MTLRVCILFLLLPTLALAVSEEVRSLSNQAQKAISERNFPVAIELLTKAIEQDSTNPALYANRASCYSSSGNLEKALADYAIAEQQAIARTGNPKDKRLAQITWNRARAYELAGRMKEAVVDYERTVELVPEYPQVVNDLIWIFSTSADSALRNPEKAFKYAQLLEGRPGKRTHLELDTLAAAYAVKGDFTTAVARQKEAAALAPPGKRSGFESRLHLYEKGKSFIENPQGAAPNASKP